MQQKLEVMRKKKQEYLEYQRQLAVHRMAQTERQIMHQVRTLRRYDSAVMYGGFQGGPQLGPPDAERHQSLGQL